MELVPDPEPGEAKPDGFVNKAANFFTTLTCLTIGSPVLATAAGFCVRCFRWAAGW